MCASTPSPGIVGGHSQRNAARLTRWSLLMLPAFVVLYFVTSFIGLYLVLGLLGLGEGDLFLMERGFAGWATEVLFALVLASAPVAGAWFAVVALRRRGRWGAWTGLVLNGLLVLLVIYMFVDAVLMTYYPNIR